MNKRQTGHSTAISIGAHSLTLHTICSPLSENHERNQIQLHFIAETRSFFLWSFFLRSCAMDFYSDEELKTLCDAVSVEPIIGEVFSKPFKWNCEPKNAGRANAKSKMVVQLGPRKANGFENRHSESHNMMMMLFSFF